MKFKIFKFNSVTSTNDVAINLIKKEKKKIGCVYANTQTKGRGSHGKKWVSNKGNLFVSILFPLKDKFPSFNDFSIINPVIIKFCSPKFQATSEQVFFFTKVANLLSRTPSFSFG